MTITKVTITVTAALNVTTIIQRERANDNVLTAFVQPSLSSACPPGSAASVVTNKLGNVKSLNSPFVTGRCALAVDDIAGLIADYKILRQQQEDCARKLCEQIVSPAGHHVLQSYVVTLLREPCRLGKNVKSIAVVKWCK